MSKGSEVIEVQTQKKRSPYERWENVRRIVLLNEITSTSAMALIAAFTIATTIMAVRIGYTPVPIYDMWAFWQQYSAGQSPLTSFFLQHNEHRIGIPKLFLFADAWWFQGKGIFPIICSLTLQTVNAVVLWHLARKKLTGADSAFLFVLLISLLFGSQQIFNFISPFQITFVGSFAFAIAAIGATGAAARALHRPTSWGWVVAAAFFGFCATHSLASGIFVWPVLILVAAVRRLPRPQLITCIVVAVVVLGNYFIGYSGSQVPLNVVFEKPHRILAFAVAYVGSPVADVFETVTSTYELPAVTWLKSLLVSIAGIALLWALAKILVQNAFNPELFAVILLLLITVGVTALGRSYLPIKDAYTSRYAGPALLLWAATLAYAIADRKLSQKKLRLVAAVACLSVLAQPAALAYVRGILPHVLAADMAFVNGVYDPDVWRNTYTQPQALLPEYKFLRDHRLAIFSRPWQSWIGRPLSDISPASKEGCTGRLDASNATAGSPMPGNRLQGWVWDDMNRRVPELIVITDEANVVIGLGMSGIHRPDVRAALNQARAENSGYLAYVPGSSPRSVSLYAVLSDELTVCKFAAGMTQ